MGNRMMGNARMDDYSNEYRNMNQDECLACTKPTYFKDGICGRCRTLAPDHIPIEQVKRYVLRIKKGKDNASNRT